MKEHNPCVRPGPWEEILFGLLLQLIANWSIAQELPTKQFSGLYLTKDDFISNKVSYPENVNHLNDIQGDFRGNIVLLRNGIATKYPYGDIFGYLYSGSKYRIYRAKRGSPGCYYKVIDDGYIVIYSTRGIYKTANTLFYYYSRFVDSPLGRLNIRNFKREFSGSKDLVLNLRKQRFRLTEPVGDHLLINEMLKSHFGSQ